MKPLTRRTALVVALVTVLAATAGLGWSHGPDVARLVARTTMAVENLAVPAALAQETLEFEAVEDSAAVGDSAREASRDRRDRSDDQRVRSGDMMRIGQDIHIEEDQVFIGDVLAIRGDVTVAGEVRGNVVAMAGDVYLEPTARVEGDVVCMGGQLYEEPGAEVGGQRVTALDRDGRRLSRGPRIHVTPQWEWNDEEIGETVVSYLILLGLIWLLARIAPGSTGAALAALKARPARSLGIGLLVWVLAVPSLIALALVVAVLCITIIGIPLAIIALLGYFVFFALLIIWGYAVGAAALGERVLMRRGEQTVTLTRAALAGVILIGSAAVLGEIFDWMDNFLPLIGALGALLRAIVVLGTLALISMGAGAWLHTEFTSGTLGRWWRGSTARVRGTRTPPPPPPPTGGDAPPPPPPPTPPSAGPPPAPAPPSTPADPAPSAGPARPEERKPPTEPS